MGSDMWILTDAGMAFLAWGLIGVTFFGGCVYLVVCMFCEKGEDE